MTYYTIEAEHFPVDGQEYGELETLTISVDKDCLEAELKKLMNNPNTNWAKSLFLGEGQDGDGGFYIDESTYHLKCYRYVPDIGTWYEFNEYDPWDE